MRYFVIIAQQRSGSHLLMNLLTSHPAIHVNEGLLTRDVETNGAAWTFEQGFHAPPGKSPELVGFTIFMKQNLHRMLRQRPGLKILLLHRRNRLATLLSRNVSHRLGGYEAPDRGIHTIDEAVARRRALSPLHISVEEAEAFFEEWTAKTEEVHQCLEGTDWLRVIYEDLRSDPDTVMRGVYQHLGLPFHPVRPMPGAGSVKLDPRPLNEAIENFLALKVHFAGTRWATFFDE